jgi:hypothetical protein
VAKIEATIASSLLILVLLSPSISIVNRYVKPDRFSTEIALVEGAAAIGVSSQKFELAAFKSSKPFNVIDFSVQ